MLGVVSHAGRRKIRGTFVHKCATPNKRCNSNGLRWVLGEAKPLKKRLKKEGFWTAEGPFFTEANEGNEERGFSTAKDAKHAKYFAHG